MENILEQAGAAYTKLLNVRYHLVLGRKGKTTDLTIVFRAENFFHLAGLHKLKRSYPILKSQHGKILSLIKKHRLTTEMLKNDENFSLLINRLSAIAHISELIENENTRFFSYDPRKVSFGTRLKADYVAKGEFACQNIAFSFFVADDTNYCMNSIFSHSGYDYSYRQTQYTVLFKERILMTGQDSEHLTIFRYKNYKEQ